MKKIIYVNSLLLGLVLLSATAFAINTVTEGYRAKNNEAVTITGEGGPCKSVKSTGGDIFVPTKASDWTNFLAKAPSLGYVILGDCISVGSPTNVTATAVGEDKAIVNFVAPESSDLGSPIFYMVYASPGNAAVSAYATDRSVTFPGLITNTTYTFTVKAGYSQGLGPASAPSNAVTPAVAQLPYITYAGKKLYVYPSDNSTSLSWGGSGTSIGSAAQSTTNGSGNTTAIVNRLGTGSNFAAGVCSGLSYSAGGIIYDDWYLPAQDQLKEMYTQRSFVNLTNYTRAWTNFATNAHYWSSTESGGGYGTTNAQDIYFPDGNSYRQSKNASFYIRCVRSSL